MAEESKEKSPEKEINVKTLTRKIKRRFQIFRKNTHKGIDNFLSYLNYQI